MRATWHTLNRTPALRRTVFPGLGLFDGLQAMVELDRSLRSARHGTPDLQFHPLPAGEDAAADGDETAGWEATLEVPGLRAEEVQLEVEDGTLRLSLAHQPHPPEGMRALRRERQAWRLQRRVRLPEDVDADAISATLRDGLLTLRLPRRRRPAARIITVEQG